jgi:3-isopropylmalate/(R)-2-methylmalate dehydratase small subunit
MKAFTTLTGVAAPLMQNNINTDIISPTPWLRSLSLDLGQGLFAVWRYDGDGQERSGFILNQAKYRNACILLSGENFGCGSSREAAVWALMKYGIGCVIAASFGDIFAGNSVQNGLLTVVLPREQIERLAEQASRKESSALLTVDLQACTVTAPGKEPIPFVIEPAHCAALLEGLDQIGATLKYEADIAAFQRQDQRTRPWIYR